MPKDRRESYYYQRLREYGPKYVGFDLDSSELLLNLIFTYDVLHSYSAPHMAEFGLSKSTFNILKLLDCAPDEGMQLHELGELLLVSRANITGLMDHLEKNGYVKRIVNASDRRARFARITKKGQALLADFSPSHHEWVKRIVSDLSTEEKRTLIALLTKLRASVTNHAEEVSKESPQLCETAQSEGR